MPCVFQLNSILVRLLRTGTCHHGPGEQVGPSKRIVLSILKPLNNACQGTNQAERSISFDSGELPR
ncbi:hypothetical protein [Gimesia sp.]|uniref:hypothetical protein n=1 Tax=Gimesia sp. TaxID=2024833 RepID=UPI003A903146